MRASGAAAPAPREVEIKFELEPGDLSALRARLAAATGDPGSSRRLISVYYDTRKATLRDHGMTLRVRSAGGGHIQTVKVEDMSGAGLFDRAEWETETGGPAPDRSVLAATPAGPLVGRKALAPLFETTVDRTVWRIETPRSLIEVALDQGHILAGTRVQPLTELELELKRGDPADLFSALRGFADLGRLRVGVQSKSERGYALAAGQAPDFAKAEPIRLSRSMSAADAARTIVHGCLRHFRLNEAVLVEHRAPGALHQSRVALRRLRSALKLFQPILADDRLDGLTAGLREAAGQLGDARNLDVYLERAAGPDAPSGIDVATLARRRETAYDEVIATLAGPAFRSLVIDLVAWIETGAWRSDPDAERTARREQPIRDDAADVLERRWRKLRKKGRPLATLKPQARHRVRIAAKTLRYAVEFFAALATGRTPRARHAAFVARLERLQRHLGDLNDIETQAEIDRTVERVEPPAPAGTAPPDAAEERIAPLLKKAVKAHRAVAEAKRFWSSWPG